MRRNLPITNNERTFGKDVKLITTTDLNSNILHCNDAFVDISGFKQEELLGQPHNIVRHPDMPPLAYQIMWEHLIAGKPWMGLVKNRSKNGDYYWVDAYVTPVTEHGRVVGYESVRSCPDRSDIKRAEKLYQAINAGNFKKHQWHLRPDSGLMLAGLVLCGLLYMFTSTGWVLLALLLTLLSYAVVSNIWRERTMTGVKALLSNAFKHELAVKTFTDDEPEIGELKVAIMSSKAHLGAVLTRIEDAAINVARQAKQGLAQAESTSAKIKQQQPKRNKLPQRCIR